MGTYFFLTLRGQPQTVNRRKTRSKFWLNQRAGTFHLGMLLAMGLLVLGLVYLFQVNNLSTKGYEIKQLEGRLTELRERQKRLELEAAALQSIQSIEEEIETLNLVPSKIVKHLPGTDYAYSD